MRSFAVNKLLTGLTVCLGLASGVLVAQTPTKIGTINLQQAVPNTAEAKAATAKLQREFVEPRTKGLEAKQAEIRDLQDKLARAGNTLSQTAKDDQQTAINRKTKDFNREVEDYQADSDDRQRELLADFSTKMQSVIAEYVQANGYAVILDTGSRDTSGLVWASSAIDITQAIIEAYDKKHPATGGTAAPAPAGAKAVTPVKPITPTPPPAKPPAGKQ
jgi:Skp family chaperone for outer membrane proteins